MSASLLLAVACAISLSSPQAVKNKVPLGAEPFSPERVRLLDSPFKTAQEADLKYLLRLEPDRLLAWFRKNAGLEPKAPNYGGWESQMLAGHSLGHYLTACAYMFAATGDARMKQRVDTIVAELKECQDAGKTGYIAAMPNADSLWATIKANGNLRGSGSYINGYWAPWYTLHKQYAGLMDAYTLCGNKTALEVCKKFGDWAIDVTSNLSPENWQRMMDGEFGGMNEAMANLYALTGERKYLDLAFKFHHKTVMDPLERGERKLSGLHGNTQIPKVIGAAREFELTGEERFKKIARNFWDEVEEDHTFVIGGNTYGEHFGPPKQLSTHLVGNTTETCNTYNMVKLAKHLFTWQPSGELGDAMERALYNHILASQNPANGMVCYYVSLQPGGRKGFSSPFDDFWCCVGTGMENHARYGESIYFRKGDRLYVNLFIPSTLDWKEKGLKLSQEGFGDEAKRTRLQIEAAKPARLELAVRMPEWSVTKPSITINGKSTAYQEEGGFAVLASNFKQGDRIEVSFSPDLHLEPTPDNPKKAAVLYGPWVLAGDLGSGQAGRQVVVPAFVADAGKLKDWMHPMSGDQALYETNGAGRPIDATLMPFYKIVANRYTVYWDFLSEEDWKKREAERAAEEARIKALDARTIDQVRIGSQASEREHNLQSERSASGEFNGRRWRHADGWFSYDVKVDPDGPNELMATFWGSDVGRTFDVVVDGKTIATVRLANNQPDNFFDLVWPLPETLSKGKEKVAVRFQAHPNSVAGGVFGVRILRPQP